MAYHNSRPRTPEVCPICGGDVPPKALACPGCGADHNSGWKPDGAFDGLDLPGDEDFDYDAFVKEEFGGGAGKSRLHPVWIATGILLLATLAAACLLGLF
jgi:hypothetical protein